MSETNTIVREMRTVPLSLIEVAEGHNPRGDVQDDAEIRTLAADVAERGMLQPLVVSRTETGFQLIVGERRYRAAALAALAEVPVAIDPRPADHPDLEEEHFEDAMSENLHRSAMSVLAIARGFARLKDRGKRTVRELAEMYGRTQADIRNHLAILDLSDELQTKIDAGTIPLTVVTKLAALGRIHPGLPDLAAARVLAPSNPSKPWLSPLTWSEFSRWPITVTTDSYSELGGALPPDVFEPFVETYPISRFTLDEKTTSALGELAERSGWTAPQVRFDRADLDAAERLKAVYRDKDGRSALIVGQDVADQLVADHIARALKQQRAADRERDQARAASAAARKESVASNQTQSDETPEQRAEREAAEAARAEVERRERLDAAKAERAAACAHNDRLGAAIWRDLSRIKVDARVIKILTAIPVGYQLSDIAMRGAIYGFPGWVSEEPARAGATKRIYLKTSDAITKVGEYLDGATTPGELAGRTLALIVMAMNVQQEAVAQSNRSWYQLNAYGMPWRDDVLELVDEIAAEVLGVEVLGKPYRERTEKRRTEAAKSKRRDKLDKHLARLLKNIMKISNEELDEIDSLAKIVHPVASDHYKAGQRLAREAAITQATAERDRRTTELAATSMADAEAYRQESAKRQQINLNIGRVLHGIDNTYLLDQLDTQQLDAFEREAKRVIGDPEVQAAVLTAAASRREQLTHSQPASPKPAKTAESGTADGLEGETTTS